MKILLVNYEYPGVTENCGGGGEVTKQLASSLIDRGHKVEIVTDTDDGSHYTFPFRTYNRIRETVDLFEPDVIHGCFSIPTSLMLPRIAREANTPLVVSVMGADVYDPTRYQLARPALDVLNGRIFSQADSVVAPSTNMANFVREKHGFRPEVIHYGIDATKHNWRERSLSESPRILTVARLVERKNHDVARHAASNIPGANYRVVGTGPLLETISRHESEEYRCLGYVNDLQEQFDWADIFLLPSEHEAFGMVFLEALASGLPVVTSNQGGQTDVVAPDVGRCVNPTPQSVEEGLIDVIDDYDSFQAATQGYVESEFSRMSMASDYESLYKNVQ